jgi:hypothetical protein
MALIGSAVGALLLVGGVCFHMHVFIHVEIGRCDTQRVSESQRVTECTGIPAGRSAILNAKPRAISHAGRAARSRA